jgi:hypothetical protein
MEMRMEMWMEMWMGMGMGMRLRLDGGWELIDLDGTWWGLMRRDRA